MLSNVIPGFFLSAKIKEERIGRFFNVCTGKRKYEKNSTHCLHVLFLLLLLQCDHSALLDGESLLLALLVVEHASSEQGSESEKLESDTSPEHVLGKLAASRPDSVACSDERGNRQTHTYKKQDNEGENVLSVEMSHASVIEMLICLSAKSEQVRGMQDEKKNRERE